ncbi:hypothetical protein [Streptomyces tibetensis]|uniref:hypothetical protein n=1 Tax=Streptomyces tibetensis TaxID=2382123 RepID=UPI0033C471FC
MPRISGIHLHKPHNGARQAEFTMHLPAWMFPIAEGGLQHLVGILVSDTFPSQIYECLLSDVQVKEVDLPYGIIIDAATLYRANERTILNVRNSFNMTNQGEPLIAFSFKPRVGFDLTFAQNVIRAVVEEGVRLVEFDTRHLSSTSHMNDWKTLATTVGDAAGRQGHTAAFAPNLSHPSHLAVEQAIQWAEAADLPEPRVVKVDGGLDGLGTLQGIRRSSSRQPIVTSYPLMRRVLSQYLGSSDTWVDFFSMCAVDIIYPGNRPTFPEEYRAVGGDDARGLINSSLRYRALVSRGRPMPSFTAGAHPGHLHSAYELLGPDVAYFLGDAIALHPSGQRRGARLCKEILRLAQENAEEAKRKEWANGKDLPARIVTEIESYRPNGRVVRYAPPRLVFAQNPTLQPFYRL